MNVFDPYVVMNVFKQEFEKRKTTKRYVNPKQIEEEVQREFEKFLKFMVQLYFQNSGGV